MGAIRRIRRSSEMASPWRRRRMCVLISDHPAPAALREVSATGAFIETNVRPELGSAVELHHPGTAREPWNRRGPWSQTW